MLLEFTVGNFLSFQDKKTLSLEAASIKDFEEDNVFEAGRYRLLKEAVVYGANSSGKSNLSAALQTMVGLILNSSKISSTDELNVTPFLLSTETERAPSYFEMVFLLGNVRYRYGFEADKKAIRAEWLFEAKVNAEKPLFLREGDGIQVFPAFKEGKDLEEKTRDNALFLSVVDQFNGTKAGKILLWFKADCQVINALSHDSFHYYTIDLLKAKTLGARLRKLYEKLDLGFDNVEILEKPFAVPESAAHLLSDDTYMQFMEVATKWPSEPYTNTSHKKFNKDGEIVSKVSFDMRHQESAGTNKIFNISGQIFRTLSLGGILFLDELDASLHPLLTLSIISLFNSPETNPRNAQMIFVTHDTNLLAHGRFRRDQIYFIEKDKYGASDLYSLAEFQVRKDASYEKDYLNGRYGGIPYIGDIKSIADDLLKQIPLMQISNDEENGEN